VSHKEDERVSVKVDPEQIETLIRSQVEKLFVHHTSIDRHYAILVAEEIIRLAENPAEDEWRPPPSACVRRRRRRRAGAVPVRLAVTNAEVLALAVTPSHVSGRWRPARSL
jgi:hypothetical protein